MKQLWIEQLQTTEVDISKEETTLSQNKSTKGKRTLTLDQTNLGETTVATGRFYEHNVMNLHKYMPISMVND